MVARYEWSGIGADYSKTCVILQLACWQKEAAPVAVMALQEWQDSAMLKLTQQRYHLLAHGCLGQQLLMDPKSRCN